MTDIYAKHLSDMVKIPTISNADPSNMDFCQFDKLRSYLEKSYPVIHERMERKVIGRANLLFKFKAKNPEKLPLLLMAHQDVVPEGEHAKWKYPPFSGEIAEGCVWGRGSIDCKSVILSELEALEALLSRGFEPKFDVYLAFSENEEVQTSQKGAQQMVDFLLSSDVRLGCVIDEGGYIEHGEKYGCGGYISTVFLGEKAVQDYEIYKECAGGHSMTPGPGTALGAVAKAIVAIEANPMPYRLVEVVARQLKELSKSLSAPKSAIYANPEENWEKLTVMAKDDKELDSLLHSTSAVTMAFGSPQSNILPDRASAIMNCRVLEGDTSESLLERFKSLIPKDVQIRLLIGEESRKATSPDCREYQLIEKTLKKLYGAETIVVPALLAGGTDSRYFTKVCGSVFRFSGYLKDGRWGNPHQVNERIPYDALKSSVGFFTELILNY